MLPRRPEAERQPLSLRCRMYYKNAALMLVNIVVAFLIINAALYFTFTLYDILKRAADPLFDRYGGEKLMQVYPEMTIEQVRVLLDETWSRSLAFAPFTHWKEVPFEGRYVNVHEAGFRAGAKRVVWPPAAENLNVFVFGGSTTFGYGVSDAETIPAHLSLFLESRIERPVHVYNFGRASYFSCQERILFEELLMHGHVPDMAVFIDGLNDFCHHDGVPLTHDESINRERPFSWLWGWPVGRLARGIARRLTTEELPLALDLKDDDLTTAVVSRYLANKKLIEAAAQEYGVATLFVWQPVSTYHYDQKYHLFSDTTRKHAYARTGYMQMARWLDRCPTVDNFLYLADMQKDIPEPLYVDRVHYTGKFCQRIATSIGNAFLERNDLDYGTKTESKALPANRIAGQPQDTKDDKRASQ